MRLLALGTLAFASVLASACSSSPMASPTSPSTSAATSSTMAALSGTWASSASSGTSAASASSACSNVQYTVTPVGTDRATVTYGATCMGIVIRGTGDGVASGNTATWNTAGSAGPCSFSLNGTATPVSNSSARITYTGTVCGMPVSGSEVLTR